MTQDAEFVSFIQFVFVDDTTDEIITLGGVGYATEHEGTAAWGAISASTGEEAGFMAVRWREVNRPAARRTIVGDHKVPVALCEALLGQPIGQLIARGRRRLAEEAGTA
jgi:hypothetical protein